MSSTFSPTLRIELIGDGDQSGIWGQTTNSNLGTLIEQAITGVQSITMLDTNYTMSSYNGVADEARNAVLIVGGTLTQQRNLIAPLVEKVYIIKNVTSGGFGIQIVGSSGTGVVIPNGQTMSVYCDGTDFYATLTGTAGNFRVAGNLNVIGTTTLGGALTYGGVTLANTVTGTGSMVLSSSPSFTGVPTAPTAAGGTNTTQIATTAFVTSVINTLGTMATQNANNVAITGGTITGSYGLTAANATNSVNAGNLTGVAGIGGYSVAGANIDYGNAGGPQVTGQSGGAAMMSFHRPGSYAINFGLGTDNQLRTGGWSRGGNFVVLDSGNYNSYAPTLGGTGANGTWNINITGSSGYATSAGSAPAAGGTSTYTEYVNNDATSMRFHWAGQGGQPTWLWGGNDPSNMYVYNPGNFSVNYANSANYCNTAGNAQLLNGRAKLGLGITGEYWQDVTGARSQGVAYYAPDYPIQVSGNFGCNGGGQGQIYIGGALISFWQAQFNGCGGYSVNMPCIVPANTQYILAAMGGSARGWYELR